MRRSLIPFLCITLGMMICFSGFACSGKQGDLSRYAPMGDEKVFYEAKGQGEPALVFIHGWSCDLTFWKEQMDFFKDYYRVVAIDLPGHGQSTQPETAYTLDLFADAVKDVLDDAGIDEAFLVGHSMGYPVARRFATKYPDRTVGMCIVDGAIFRVPDDPIAETRWTQDMREFVKQFKGENRDAVVVGFINNLFVPESPEELRKQITTKMLLTPAHVGNSAMEEMVKAENWKEYSLDLPVLAVSADNYLPEDNEEYLLELYPDLDYHVMEHIGHFIMMERPEEFDQILLEYLQKRFGTKQAE